jgi:hypothetical protein
MDFPVYWDQCPAFYGNDGVEMDYLPRADTQVCPYKRQEEREKNIRHRTSSFEWKAKRHEAGNKSRHYERQNGFPFSRE